MWRQLLMADPRLSSKLNFWDPEVSLTVSSVQTVLHFDMKLTHDTLAIRNLKDVSTHFFPISIHCRYQSVKWY